MRELIEEGLTLLNMPSLEERTANLAQMVQDGEKKLKDARQIHQFYSQLERFVRSGQAKGMAPEIEATAKDLLRALEDSFSGTDRAQKKLRDLQDLLQGYASGHVGRRF